MMLIDALDKIQLLALQIRGKLAVVNIVDELFDFDARRIQERTLVDAWQESRLPVLRTFDRVAAGRHGDEPRQIFIFATQAVR